MDKRTCTVTDCERPHAARGMCSSHYGTWHRQTHGRKPNTFDRTCEACGDPFEASAPDGRFCSQLCFVFNRNGPQSCRWPRHQKREPKPKPAPFMETRSCRWCEQSFTTKIRAQVFCCADHKARAKRVRRRGREHGWTSNFTWAEVMRVLRKFDGRCAYCEQPLEGPPDPDHVVPLSRGGCNSITNILPCCSPCNSDKRDLLLSEWAIDRGRRGLEPRVTAWANGDRRVAHLTVELPVAAA